MFFTFVNHKRNKQKGAKSSNHYLLTTFTRVRADFWTDKNLHGFAFRSHGTRGWIIKRFWETANGPPTPPLASINTSRLGQNAGLGEGLVGSFPETKLIRVIGVTDVTYSCTFWSRRRKPMFPEIDVKPAPDGHIVESGAKWRHNFLWG